MSCLGINFSALLADGSSEVILLICGLRSGLSWHCRCGTAVRANRLPVGSFTKIGHAPLGYRQVLGAQAAFDLLAAYFNQA